MTPDDKQIDLLMRRYAQGAEPQALGAHLDADEMNTFAEGALPPAARAKYVSHLAQCDHCRKQVSQLMISTGAVARAEVAATPERQTFWASLSALFSPVVLRYAAFTAVLVIAAGVTFIALRRPSRPSDLVASRTEAEQHPASAIQPPASSSNGQTYADSNARPQQSGSPSVTGSDQSGKRDTNKFAEATPAPLVAKEAPAPPSLEAKKTGTTESVVVRDQPSYAPPPPGEAAKPASVAGVVSQQEQRKAEQSLDKAAAVNRGREDDSAKDARDNTFRNTTTGQPTAVQRRVADEKTKGGPSRNFENNAARNANENRAESNTLGISAPKAADKNAADREEAQTRSAGGRKFRKQGNAWVDQKFKSSMTLKSVARGSEDFNSLDSGLKSIAQQIGGEVIVVWKGKAYLIK